MQSAIQATYIEGYDVDNNDDDAAPNGCVPPERPWQDKTSRHFKATAATTLQKSQGARGRVKRRLTREAMERK